MIQKFVDELIQKFRNNATHSIEEDIITGLPLPNRPTPEVIRSIQINTVCRHLNITYADVFEYFQRKSEWTAEEIQRTIPGTSQFDLFSLEFNVLNWRCPLSKISGNIFCSSIWNSSGITTPRPDIEESFAFDFGSRMKLFRSLLPNLPGLDEIFKTTNNDTIKWKNHLDQNSAEVFERAKEDVRDFEPQTWFISGAFSSYCFGYLEEYGDFIYIWINTTDLNTMQLVSEA